MEDGIFLALAIWSLDTSWSRDETNHRVQFELNKMTPWRKQLQGGPQIPTTCHFSMSHVRMGLAFSLVPEALVLSLLGQGDGASAVRAQLKSPGRSLLLYSPKDIQLA